MIKEKIYDRGITAKRPNSESEGLFFDKMRKAGWSLTKRGWPDFFCVNIIPYQERSGNYNPGLVNVQAHRIIPYQERSE